MSQHIWYLIIRWDHLLDLSTVCDIARSFVLKQFAGIKIENVLSMNLLLHMTIAESSKDVSSMEQCICVVVYIYTECIRNQVNPLDFGDVIGSVGVIEDHKSILEKAYNQIVF